MTLSDANLRLALGANLLPDSGDISGAFHLGRDLALTFPDATVVWAARIVFTAGAQTCTIKPYDGVLSKSAGVTVTRSGGSDFSTSGLDIYGEVLPTIDLVRALAIFSADDSAASVTPSILAAAIAPGNFAVIGGAGISVTAGTSLVLTSAGAATLDLILIGETSGELS